MKPHYPMHRVAPQAMFCVIAAGAIAIALGTPMLARATGAADGPFALDVRPGGFDEVCLNLAAGRAIEFGFVADGAVDFNLHYHHGREVFYPVRKTALRDLPPTRFTAAATDDYCLMWENRGPSPVRIVGRVTRPLQ